MCPEVLGYLLRRGQRVGLHLESQALRHALEACHAAGVDGLFFEVHEDPDRALSDGPNSVPLDDMPALLKRLRAIATAAGSPS